MSKEKDISKLLARGGRVLALAAVAYARGHRSDDTKWFGLGADLQFSGRQILKTIEKERDPTLLARALKAAMGEDPATRAPAWTRPLVENPKSFEMLGKHLSITWPPYSSRPGTMTFQQKGLAACAISLCRSQDAVDALGAQLHEDDAADLVRMAALAQTLVQPGDPSAMKKKIVSLLKENYGDPHGTSN